jgi:hypothetical protein
MLQIGARLRVIGHELQSPQEILPRLADPARPCFEHAKIVPVIGVVRPQMKCCLSLRNRRFQLPRTGQCLRQLRMQIRIGRRQGDRLPQLHHRLVHASRQRIGGGELLTSIHIFGALVDSALQQARGLLGLTGLKGQPSQVIKSGEIVGIDFESGPKLGFRGIRVPSLSSAAPSPLCIAASAGHCASMVRNCCSAALA